MNSFCQCLRLALLEKFNIEVDVFVSKKEAPTFILGKTSNFLSKCEGNSFIRNYWCQRKYFFSGYFYIRPRLNQSLKWRYDYIFLVKNKAYNKRLTTY